MNDALPRPALDEDSGTPSADLRSENRLRLNGSRAPSEHIDGVWWPASKRLADELPALMAAVGDFMPHVAVVGYRRDGWTAPSSITLDGEHPVELLEFVSSEPPTLILIGDDGHHLTLRIIDPETDESQAQRSLAEVPRRTEDVTPAGRMHARSVQEVANKLARHEGRNDPERDAQILRWCQEAAAQFEEARIQTFVPILVEHIVNNRIHHERHLATASSIDQPTATAPSMHG